MKKLLLLTAALLTALSFNSCNDDDDPDPEPEPELTYKLEVDETSLIFEADATEAQTVTVTSENITWTAGVDDEAADWLTITVTDNIISVTVTEWDQYDARTGIITVTPTTDEVTAKTVTVIQNPIEEPEGITIDMGMLYFYGDYYGVNAGNYMLGLIAGEYVIGEDGSVTVSDGYLIQLDMIAGDITKEEVRADIAELPDGTYTCSSNYEQMSFIGTSYNADWDFYDGSLVENYSNGDYLGVLQIVDGTVDVRKNGDVYNIIINFVYDDGTTDIFIFDGEMLEAANLSHNSTYKEDITITGLSEGDLTFFSHMYDMNCYSWDVRMSTPGLINNDGEYGTGTEILLTLQSPATSTTVLDNGTYTFDQSYSYGPFTAVPGSVFFGVFPIDSWVFEYENGNWVNYSPIVSGTVTVSATPATVDHYSITLEGEGDNYYAINATYSGVLTYIDNSSDSEVGSVRKSYAKTNNTNTLQSFKQKKGNNIIRNR